MSAPQEAPDKDKQVGTLVNPTDSFALTPLPSVSTNLETALIKQSSVDGGCLASQNSVSSVLTKAAPLETGTPAKGRNVMLSVCSFILCNEFCERMGYYGLQGSLNLFMTSELNMSAPAASKQTNNWSAVCYVMPLLGGWLADAYWGRFKTIFVFILAYLLGMILITVASQSVILSAPLFFVALYIVALGTGGIKPNVSSLGADQFDDSNPYEAKQKTSYFNYFYMSVNVGATVAFTAISYVCQNISFSIGWTIPAASMAIAVLTFFLGSKRYKKLPPGGSVLGKFMGVMYSALWGNRHASNAPTIMDKANTQYGGAYSAQFVQDCRQVLRLIPFMVFFIIYWCIYGMMATVFYSQGCQMNFRMGSFDMPISALNVWNSIIIVVVIPICELIYPILRRKRIHFTSLHKIGVGFMLSALSMVSAAITEIKRKELHNAGHIIGPASVCYEDCDVNDPTCVVGTDMNIMWQSFGYILIGIGEVFASVTLIDLFYSEAPHSMRSVCSALSLFTSACGTWVQNALIEAINSNKENQWYPESSDMNNGHIDWFFWVMACAQFLDLLALCWFGSYYNYNNPVAAGYKFQDELEQAVPVRNDNDGLDNTETDFKRLADGSSSPNGTSICQQPGTTATPV